MGPGHYCTGLGTLLCILDFQLITLVALWLLVIRFNIFKLVCWKFVVTNALQLTWLYSFKHCVCTLTQTHTHTHAFALGHSIWRSCVWACVIGKCEIEFSMRFSVLGKIFERTLIVLSCLALEKLEQEVWMLKFHLNGKTLRTTLKNLVLVGKL